MSAVRRELTKLLALLALARDVQTELQRHLERLEHKIRDRCCEHECRADPAHITLTVSTSPEGTPMSNFPVGKTMFLTAVVDNKEDVPVTDQPSFTATGPDGSALTVTVDPDNAQWASIDGAPLGDVTITATTSNGIVSEPVVVTVVDGTPASITVTVSDTPNTPAT